MENLSSGRMSAWSWSAIRFKLWGRRRTVVSCGSRAPIRFHIPACFWEGRDEPCHVFGTVDALWMHPDIDWIVPLRSRVINSFPRAASCVPELRILHQLGGTYEV